MRFIAGMSAVLAFSLPLQSVRAADAKEFEYPELMVSPSASERLAIEAKSEAKSRWTAHWAIQASALTTLMAGMSSNGDPGKNADEAARKGEEVGSKSAAKAATYVGGLWLVATTAMSAAYTPYQSGLAGLKGIAQGNKKEKLAYERYAEEALYAPSRVATIMKWGSVITNGAASAMVSQNATKPMTKFMGALGVAGSLLPLAFEHQWNEVYRFQGEYKKRIYGPLTSANISIVPHNGAMSAMTNLAWEF